MRLPLIVALGLLVTSFAALTVSIGDHAEHSVAVLSTVPGVTQVASSGGGLGLAAPSGTSPYATYVPPANPPPPTAAQAAAAAAAQAPAPAPPMSGANPPPVTGGGFGGPHHRRG